MPVITPSDFFSAVTGGTITGGGIVRRVPFSFTSTARLIKSGKIASLGNTYTAATAKTTLSNELKAIEEETRPISAAIRSGAGLLSSILPFQGVSPTISMSVNPHSVKWSQPKRFTKRDTMSGSVYFHFTNKADQNNDILVCTFTGRTGNINTNVNPLEALAIGSNQKLKVWHDLYNLSREGMLLNKGNTGAEVPAGMRNEFFISYTTMLMPVPITLIGFFNSALEFTEDASDPFNRIYSFSFTVTNTSPSLDDLTQKLSSALVQGNAVAAVGQQVARIPGAIVTP